MADTPPVLRPIPRRAFELTPASTDSSPPSPSSEPVNPDPLVDRKLDSLSPSRTRSILNLTSSTLLGIYSNTGHDGPREESSTPWGTGAQTPSQRRSVDESRSETSMLSWNAKTQQPQVPRRRTKPGFLQIIFRSLVLFVFGIAYGLIITHLHRSQNMSRVRLPGVEGHFQYQLLAWGLSGVLLGSALPWVDQKWAEAYGAREVKENDVRSSKGSAWPTSKLSSSFLDFGSEHSGDWYSAVRSIGAFVGIAFAVV